jgi:hypothetical protein
MSTLSKAELATVCKYCGIQPRFDQRKEELGKMVLNRLHKGLLDCLRVECEGLKIGDDLRADSNAAPTMTTMTTKATSLEQQPQQLPSLSRVRASDWTQCNPGLTRRVQHFPSRLTNPLFSYPDLVQTLSPRQEALLTPAVQEKDGVFITVNPNDWRSCSGGEWCHHSLDALI